MFECEECGEVMNSFPAYMKHMETHPPLKDDEKDRF